MLGRGTPNRSLVAYRLYMDMQRLLVAATLSICLSILKTANNNIDWLANDILRTMSSKRARYMDIIVFTPSQRIQPEREEAQQQLLAQVQQLPPPLPQVIYKHWEQMGEVFGVMTKATYTCQHAQLL